MSGVPSPPLALRGRILDRVGRWGPVSVLPAHPEHAAIVVEDWTESGVAIVRGSLASPRTERPC